MFEAPIPNGYRGEGLLVDVGQLVHDHGGRGEDPVGVQEGVKEVDGQKAQVSQPLQKALYTGVAYLGDLAGVEGLAEANVDVVFVKPGIRPGEVAG